MKLHNLKPAEGSKSSRKRVGRGTSSGMGKTSTKGHKGQKARSGGGTRPGFEGGQTPIYRRLPKRGFTNIHAKTPMTIINIEDLLALKMKDVDPKILLKKGLINDENEQYKILANLQAVEKEHAKGKWTELLTSVKAHKFSENAKKLIEKNGGKTSIITK